MISYRLQITLALYFLWCMSGPIPRVQGQTHSLELVSSDTVYEDGYVDTDSVDTLRLANLTTRELVVQVQLSAFHSLVPKDPPNEYPAGGEVAFHWTSTMLGWGYGGVGLDFQTIVEIAPLDTVSLYGFQVFDGPAPLFRSFSLATVETDTVLATMRFQSSTDSVTAFCIGIVSPDETSLQNGGSISYSSDEYLAKFHHATYDLLGRSTCHDDNMCHLHSSRMLVRPNGRLRVQLD